MSRKRISGLIGMVVGGVWFAHNLQYFNQQGFVAISMPAIIFVLGVVYFFKGKNAA